MFAVEFVAVLFLALPGLLVQDAGTELPHDLAPLARAAARPAEFHAQPAGKALPDVLVARHAAQSLEFAFAAGRVHVRAQGEVSGPLLELQLHAWGRPGALRSTGTPAPAAAGARVSFGHDELEEWYVNGPAGLEHGFTVAGHPQGAAGGWLEFHVRMGGDLRPVARPGATGVALLDASDGEVLGYDGLHAWDADGRSLPVSLDVRGRDVVLRVDDGGARYPLTVDPLLSSTQGGLVAPQPEADAAFGFAVSLSGDLAAVGAPQASVAGLADAGKVYVFRRNAIWQLEDEIVSPAPLAGARFGHAVALKDELLAVGEPGAKVGAFAGAGAAHLFQANGGNWQFEESFTASDAAAGDAYGSALAFDGTTLVAGAPNNATAAGAGAGRAYVIGEFSVFGWMELDQLDGTGAAAGDAFGSSVTVDGGMLAVGAPGRQSGRGAAYAFTGSLTQWNPHAMLTDSVGAAGDALGTSVSLAGSTLVTGAPGRDAGATNAGEALVYLRTGSTWSLQARLAPPAPTAEERLGTSVALDQDRVLAGAPGARSYSVAVDEWEATGAACIWDRIGNFWYFEGRVVAFDAVAGDELGVSVDVEGTRTLAGRWQRDLLGAPDAGSAIVHSLNEWQPGVDLGFALAPPLDEPILYIDGLLLPGTPGLLRVEFARPLAPAMLFFSPNSGLLPFKGGTLVPGEPLFQVPLVTDASGKIELAWGSWPSGLPPQTAIFFHVAVLDPAGPQGVVLTNALLVYTLQ